MTKTKQLTKEQIETLRAYKGKENGKEDFLKYLEDIYADDTETLALVKQCHTILKDLDWITTGPAYAKSESMYHKQYVDELLERIGYTAED